MQYLTRSEEASLLPLRLSTFSDGQSFASKRPICRTICQTLTHRARLGLGEAAAVRAAVNAVIALLNRDLTVFAARI